MYRPRLSFLLECVNNEIVKEVGVDLRIFMGHVTMVVLTVALHQTTEEQH
jgi:hypothetical protein